MFVDHCIEIFLLLYFTRPFFLIIDCVDYYPLANEVGKGYIMLPSVRPSFHPSFCNILVTTLESTPFNDFDQTWYILSP